MTDFAAAPDFADQDDGSLYYVTKQEPDNYVDKRIRSNVLNALESPAHPRNVSDGLWGTYQNLTTESTNSVSQTTDKINIKHIVPPIHDRVLERHQVQHKPTLTPTAEWEGYVDSVGEEDFFVVMTNVRSKSSLPTDQAVFPKDDINEHERPLLKEGAIVRWIIGRERLPTGQIRKVSELYFRRLPAHTKADYNRAFHKAKSLLEEVVWDDGTQV